MTAGPRLALLFCLPLLLVACGGLNRATPPADVAVPPPATPAPAPDPEPAPPAPRPAPDARAQLQLGETLRAQGRLAEAEEVFGLAIKLDSDRVEPRLARAECRLEREDWAGALTDLEDCIALDPDSARAHIRRGLAGWRAGWDPDLVRQSFAVGLKLDPDDPEGYRYRGRFLLAQGEFPPAVADFTRLVELRPDDLDASLLLSETLAGNGQRPEALQELARAHQLAPDDPRPPRREGRIRLAERDFDAAIEAFELARRLDPDEDTNRLLSLCYFRRGIRRETAGDYLGSRNDFERGLELDEGNSMFLNNYAWMLCTCPDQAVRDGPRAVELAERAVEMSDWAEAHIIDTLAAAHAEAGDFAQAVKIQEMAIQVLRAEAGYVEPGYETRLQRYRQGQTWREP